MLAVFNEWEMNDAELLAASARGIARSKTDQQGRFQEILVVYAEPLLSDTLDGDVHASQRHAAW